jgi:hypothetical protein
MYNFGDLSKYRWDGREKKSTLEPRPIRDRFHPALREQPKMMERVQRILEIANSIEGPLKLLTRLRNCYSKKCVGWEMTP